MSDCHATDKKHKKGRAFFLMAVLVLCLFFPVRGEAKVKAPKMECHAYAVMDAGSGEVLFGQDENKVIYPASTAKLMTAIVCVENGNVNKKIKTTSEIINGTTYGTYCLGLPVGVKFTFKDLLNISLVSSAADATDSLAAGVFGSKAACVEAMNAKCRELGLVQTSFDNPVGSDIGAGFDKTYSTAAEMAKVCRYAMTIPMIRSAVEKSHYDASAGGMSCNTTNWFLRGMASYDEDRYEIIGTKSGTTNAAGHVFIATAVDDEGHEVICAYFGNVSKESTFSSIRKLFDYTFQKYDAGKLQLTSSNYDVRCSKDLGAVYDTYASLNCYPTSRDGLFHPNRAVTRTELAAMLRGVNGLEESGVLDVFEKGNRTGNVTAGRLALLIRDLFPEHLTAEAVEEALAGCTGTEGLTEEEKEAFALFIKNGLAVDDSCKNAGQVLTRKQALLIADRLSDHQVRYAASHPVFLTGETGAQLPEQAAAATTEANAAATTVTASTAATEATAAATTAAGSTAATEATAAATTAAGSTAATEATAEATTAAGSTAATEEDAGGPPAYEELQYGQMDALAGFNKKWMEHLINQITAAAENGV